MILVTGATGHIGNVLVHNLVAQGEEVRALVLPGDPCTAIEDIAIERVEGNVLDEDSLRRAMQGVDTVYHLAGIISILPGAEELMQRVNVEGPRNVARVALESGVRRMVHVSSVHAFERQPYGVVMDETTPFAIDNPAGAYDKTKAEGMLAVLDYVQQGLDAVIVCPAGVIGPYDYEKSEMGQTIRSFARKGLHFLVAGGYDFVDVRDVVAGILLAYEKGHTGEVYILSGTYVKVVDLWEMVQEITGNHSPRVVMPFRLALLLARLLEPFYRLTRTTPRFTGYSLHTLNDNARFSCAKAEGLLGYQTQPLRETLVDTLAWHERREERCNALRKVQYT